jgi:hypothetical protein
MWLWQVAHTKPGEFGLGAEPLLHLDSGPIVGAGGLVSEGPLSAILEHRPLFYHPIDGEGRGLFSEDCGGFGFSQTSPL